MDSAKIGIIGLGYVGLPLACMFAKKYSVIGFDTNRDRINELNLNKDTTNEINPTILSEVLIEQSGLKGLFCTNQAQKLSECSYYIITVPTPVDADNNPELDALFSASKTAGKVLKKGDVVIYESTVYPGATEEECVPILEEHSGLKLNIDFGVGYSPERINPGDKDHTVEKILKVTSGSTPEIAKKVNDLYASVIVAGTYLAPSIKVAEAAKVIENSQRDINIAFVNELAKIFNLLKIDTNDVLKAASTKWNFLPFKPGLVGGHCIGVDPYYLAKKAQKSGYNPEIILAGRKINDGMGNYVASEIIKLMISNDIDIKEANILVLGITFKENCPDVRNSKVVDMIRSLESYSTNVTIYDPLADSKNVKKEHNIYTTMKIPKAKFNAIVLAVAHKEFEKIDLKKYLAKKSVIYDVKGVLDRNLSNGRL